MLSSDIGICTDSWTSFNQSWSRSHAAGSHIDQHPRSSENHEQNDASASRNSLPPDSRPDLYHMSMPGHQTTYEGSLSSNLDANAGFYINTSSMVPSTPSPISPTTHCGDMLSLNAIADMQPRPHSSNPHSAPVFDPSVRPTLLEDISRPQLSSSCTSSETSSTVSSCSAHTADSTSTAPSSRSNSNSDHEVEFESDFDVDGQTSISSSSSSSSSSATASRLTDKEQYRSRLGMGKPSVPVSTKFPKPTKHSLSISIPCRAGHSINQRSVSLNSPLIAAPFPKKPTTISGPSITRTVSGPIGRHAKSRPTLGLSVNATNSLDLAPSAGCLSPAHATTTISSSSNQHDNTTNSQLMPTNYYPNGPVLIDEPNVYLFSEPTASIASQFDLVINVAKDVLPLSMSELQGSARQPEYIHVPWDHNASSTLCHDLAWLTRLMEDRADRNQKILVHCQCGVSRSASLVVAYIMRRHHLDLNSAYTHVKQRSPHISPNMTLMFQLMEWDITNKDNL